MDLRKQDEKIRQWLEQDIEEDSKGESDNSSSETEDIVEMEVHKNTSSESEVSSESDYEPVCPSKRQRTQIIESEESDNSESIRPSRRQTSRVIDSDETDEDVMSSTPQNIPRNPNVIQPSSRFLYGKNKHKWSSAAKPSHNMLNLSIINAYVVYVSNNVRNNKKPMSRRDFVIKLGDQLMEPWLRQRLQTVTLRRDIKVMIQDILGESSDLEAPVPSVSNVRKICYLCPSKARRMTKHRCIKCKQALCGPHNVDICSRCIE
ncbi:uncharacterized protein LOC126369782 [Pectinophora gossypiella]|uniref:uncharacterized protein LOC126369782 n=1 Tax=Pectinophora gossypiella TaxID=13191 RepID=UPI00214F394C|nr:uncharacterized protein LOC126369782 [Pectinophora gossypiella]